MDKLLILLKGEVVDELVLDKGKLVLGRESSCDLQLDDSSVSRRHVKLTRIMSGYLLEDLGSTNGTSVNGKPVRKQMLKQGDILKIGKFRLPYVSGEAGSETEAEVLDKARQEPEESEGAVPVEEPASSTRPPPATKKRGISGKATLNFVAGPEEGRVEELQKGLFTIGRPGEGVGTVACRSQGFFLLHLGGGMHPMVNGTKVESGGALLNDGDLIEVGKHRVRITIESSH